MGFGTGRHIRRRDGQSAFTRRAKFTNLLKTTTNTKWMSLKSNSALLWLARVEERYFLSILMSWSRVLGLLRWTRGNRVVL